jgi:flagellar biosynthesis protein FlhB
MTKKNALALACKIIGILTAVYTARFLYMLVIPAGQALGGGHQWVDMVSAIFIFGGLVIPAAAAVALIVWAERIAKWLCGERADDVVTTGVETKELQEVAFSVLGLWLATTALVSLAVVVYSFGSRIIQDQAVSWVPRAKTVANLLQLAVGLFLLFSARGFVGFIRILRKAGHTGATENEQ